MTVVHLILTDAETDRCRRGLFGGLATFRFLKGGIPRAYPAWDLSILRMLARSCISGGTGEGEKEARRCMSHRSPPLQKKKTQRWPPARSTLTG